MLVLVLLLMQLLLVDAAITSLLGICHAHVAIVNRNLLETKGIILTPGPDLNLNRCLRRPLLSIIVGAACSFR